MAIARLTHEREDFFTRQYTEDVAWQHGFVWFWKGVVVMVSVIVVAIMAVVLALAFAALMVVRNRRLRKRSRRRSASYAINLIDTGTPERPDNRPD